MSNGLKSIKKLIKADLSKGLSQVDIAKKVKVSTGAIYKYLETETKPSSETIVKFAKAYNVPVDYFFSESVLSPRQESERAGMTTIDVPTRKVPVYDAARCGAWLKLGDEPTPEFWEATDSKDPDAHYVIARGNSMIGYDIKENDLLLVEPGKAVENGNIVIAIHPENGTTIKKYFRHNDHIELRAGNDNTPSIILPYAKLHEMFKVQKITEIKRKL